MSKYLIFLNFEDESYYTYIEAETEYMAVAEVSKNFTKSVQSITIYKEMENGDYKRL